VWLFGFDVGVCFLKLEFVYVVVVGLVVNFWFFEKKLLPHLIMT
jgi:hypothetical protein